MTDRFEYIREKLVVIEEELRDLAFEELREVARAPESDGAPTAAAQEKKLLQARRAIAKAIGALAPVQSDDEAGGTTAVGSADR